ncbi:tRNA-intron lyase [Candidatus Parvarchaeota archaeon]|nr:tRNA-intron lyase [Candidatus Parvarchaeota archaeon]
MKDVILTSDRVIVLDQGLASTIHNKGYFGSFQDSRLELSFEEAAYLCEKKELPIYGRDGKKLNFKQFITYAEKKQRRFWTRYCVFRDMRSSGYILKTAFKYGGDFRVYKKGDYPGKAHAEWILYVSEENDSIKFSSFAAINRVAHSVKKRVLFGVVDNEDSVTYYEIKWVKI